MYQDLRLIDVGKI